MKQALACSQFVREVGVAFGKYFAATFEFLLHIMPY